ncbi:MAG: hypothetical protein M0C28_36470 [Candidatus Moduliflexus flocculans]|nr:hypothetical protein [Candidatus Moduliflexus flocculans]
MRPILHEGKMELLGGAYCLGDEECTDYAWSIFANAVEESQRPAGRPSCVGSAGNTLIWVSLLTPMRRRWANCVRVSRRARKRGVCWLEVIADLA